MPTPSQKTAAPASCGGRGLVLVLPAAPPAAVTSGRGAAVGAGREDFSPAGPWRGHSPQISSIRSARSRRASSASSRLTARNRVTAPGVARASRSMSAEITVPTMA